MVSKFVLLIFNSFKMKHLYSCFSLTVILLLTLSVSRTSAQSVGIAGTAITPDAQSIFEIQSTTKGVLLPRMTTAQTATLAASLNASDAGMTVYDTDIEAYKYWDGASLQWQTIPSTSSITHNTLDDAYDEGGAGAGRVITADNGAVDIQGTGGLLVNGVTGIGTSSPDANYKMTVLNSAGPTVKVGGTNTGIGLLVEANAGAEDGISAIHSSTSNGSAYYAVRGEVTNESGEGYLGYHTTGDRSYGVYGADGTFAGYFEGNTNVATGNVGIGLNTAATDKLVVAGGRVEFTATTDASSAAGTGVLEIANSLRLDGNEIITNSGTTLLLQNDNNSALNVDNGTLFVDASTNRVSIGNTSPAYDLYVSGNTRTTGDFYGDIHVDDTRAVNSPPTTYDQEVAFDFKNRTTVGAPGSGTYSGMMTFAPWADNTGDASHQINFNEGGLYWRQGQPSAGSWGTWYEILTTANGLPTGSGTANYLTRWTPDGSTLGIGITYDNGTNVGIGTTVPSSKLNVHGSSQSIEVSNSAETDAGIVFNDNDAPTSQYFEIMFNSSDEDLHIRSDDNSAADIMTLLHEGNVGIGTTSPEAKLNVGGSTGATIYLTREDNVTVANDVLGSLLFDSTDDTAPSTSDASAVVRGHASQNHGNSNKGGYLTFLTKDNVSNGTSATERMRIAANGNVGIGTSSPDAQLDVEDNTEYPVILHRTGNVGAVGTEYHDNDANGQTGYLSFNHRDASSSGNSASFHLTTTEPTLGVIIDTDGGFYADTELALRSNGISYLNGGNVGIGITTPTALLELYGSTKDLEISNTSETDAGIIFNDAQATGSQYAEITYGSSDNDLNFLNASTTPRMVIESNGDVGIGTVSPGARFHVSGDFYNHVLAEDENTTTWSTGTNGSWVNTSCAVTITTHGTGTSNSSVYASVVGSVEAYADFVGFRIVRDGTNMGGGFQDAYIIVEETGQWLFSASIMDDAATAASHTYTLQYYQSDGGTNSYIVEPWMQVMELKN